MTTTGADVLRRLRAEIERLGTELFDLEHDPTRTMLAHATLRGPSALQWQAAERTYAETWAGYDVVRGLLDRPSTSIQDVAAAERCLTYDIPRLVEAADRLRTMVYNTDRVWTQLVPRLAHLRDRLGALSGAANALGAAGVVVDPDDPDLEGAGRQLAEAAELVADDPLSARPTMVDHLDRLIDGLERRVTATARFRDDFVDHVADARARLAGLDQAFDVAVAAHREAHRKIAGCDGAAPTDRRSALRDRLDRAVTTGNGRRWFETMRCFEDVAAGIDAAHDELVAHAVRSRTPIVVRNELRARLAAYRVKAERSGRLEDEATDGLFTRAHTVLYTAPTDLSEAARLVASYQRSLASDGGGERW